MSTTLLKVSDLGRSFGGLQALSGVTFSVEEREVFGIIGPNGAGKTTLFNCLSGLIPPSEGQVFFAGRRIDGQRSHDICRLGLARTFQLVRPFHGMSVVENVMVASYGRYPRPMEAREHALEALGQVGMGHLAERDAERLSVAEMRRLEIARAIATGPQLLLLDEMMAGLTATESDELCEQVSALNRSGITILVVEHSVPIIRRLCGNAIVLNFGAMLARGRVEEVLSDPAVQDAYLGSAGA